MNLLIGTFAVRAAFWRGTACRRQVSRSHLQYWLPARVLLFWKPGFSPALHVLRWRFYVAVTLSLPPAQKRRNDPRIAATVQYRQHNERPFIGCVRNQIIPHRIKTQWPRTQIGTAMSLLWERDE